MTVEEFWRLTPGEALRVVEAYRRRQYDALEVAYAQAAIAAAWNSAAVWGKRRQPSLDSLLDALKRPDSDASDGEPTDEHRQAEASFDEARMRVRMRVMKERQQMKEAARRGR